MFLLAGLGNPGARYAANRHNAGFMAVEAVAERYCFPAFVARHHGEMSRGHIGTHDVLLFKPQTFMNRSGDAVGEAARFYRIPLSHIWVIHDDLDLAPCKIRIKRGGSDGGHNGLKSITQHLGAEYGRVRIGIGRPEHAGEVTHYVLGDFTPDEWPTYKKCISLLAAEIPSLLEGHEDRVMNNIARMA